MATKSVKSIELKSSTKCEGIYPKTSKKDGSLRDTVAIKLNKQEARELATLLLVGAKDWDNLKITAFRGTKQVTVVTVD